MSSSIQYNPNPPRVWSRVQNICSTIAYTNDDPSANSNFAKAEYDRQMMLKGNVLQYKKNSSNLTKKQRYTQIAKGMWTNRTKTWATQSDTYTNPNMTSLLRVNYTILDPSNNNFSSRQNPFGCPSNSIQDGGNLVCNVVVNPCTQEVVKRSKSQQLCNPTTDSNVPGQIQQLCWNDGTQTWYPRQRYIMSNSGTKWPINYKEFTSALKFVGPILSVGTIPCGQLDIPLSWTFLDSTCAPITSFNIYQNGAVILSVPVTQTSITISGNPAGTYEFFVTSVSNTFESEKSNIIFVSTQYNYKSENAFITNNGKTIIFLQNGSISFLCNTNIKYTIVGGGGSGGYDSSLRSGLAAGGGGHVLNSTLPILMSAGSNLYITIGEGGIAPKSASPSGTGKIGGNTTITGSYSVSTNNQTYGGGGGGGYSGVAWGGGGGIGDNVTSAKGGIFTNYYSNFDNNGTGGAGGSLNTTLGNNGGSNSSSAAGNGGNGQLGIDGNYYGGGGGGGVKSGGAGGSGGTGGGGKGANYNYFSKAEAGKPNTGGGGGAGYYVDSTRPLPSANGGSGIAIIMIM